MDTAERTASAALDPRVSETFHRQHLEATGRLLASIAHDVRSAVASIVYSADFLDGRGGAVQQEILRATVRDISEAGRHLQLTVDSLLDYAHLGPTISVPISLREMLGRAHGLLRSFYRDGAHGLKLEIGAGAEYVRGNPVAVEQIFVNVLLCAAECAGGPSLVTVSAHAAAPDLETGAAGSVQIRIGGEGRELARKLPEAALGAEECLEAAGVKLALADAQTAAAAQGGMLWFEPRAQELHFLIRLPRSEGPR